jgi:hypothetical protein
MTEEIVMHFKTITAEAGKIFLDTILAISTEGN